MAISLGRFRHEAGDHDAMRELDVTTVSSVTRKWRPASAVLATKTAQSGPEWRYQATCSTMTLLRLSAESIVGLDRASFRDSGITERGDLQRILRDHISVIVPDALVISEEFSSWDRSDRRIDLLAVDRKGCLVVIELKRTSDDSFADLQALRYAAMVAQMTFEQAVDELGRYLDRRGIDDDPQGMLVRHLCWVSPDEGPFNENVRIVLAAADFSPEVTSTVLWLNERDLDITCVRLQPYRLNGEILLDVQQIIPLPEAADYQVQIRQKQREVRAAIAHSSDWTKYDVTLGADIRQALFKRDVVYSTVRFLVTRGILPNEIDEAAGRRIFEHVDGVVDSDAFRAELQRRRPNDTKVLRRYFCADDELLVIEGSTYAISNQWTKATMEQAMDALVQKFAAHGLSYRVAEPQTAV
jgi:hypothetical protein